MMNIRTLYTCTTSISDNHWLKTLIWRMISKSFHSIFTKLRVTVYGNLLARCHRIQRINLEKPYIIYGMSWWCYSNRLFQERKNHTLQIHKLQKCTYTSNGRLFMIATKLKTIQYNLMHKNSATSPSIKYGYEKCAAISLQRTSKPFIIYKEQRKELFFCLRCTEQHRKMLLQSTSKTQQSRHCAIQTISDVLLHAIKLISTFLWYIFCFLPFIFD